MPKQKNVYSVDVFRGLDKENKLTKVEPFRASDGKNFIIDSDTLKTRPAVKYSDEIPFTIESNDFVIDWYEFRNVTLYVTRRHVYASYNNEQAINEEDALFIVGNFGEIDFNGFTPLFREEKNALFIFGLNNVFVFSYIERTDGAPHRYVFYTINQKPVNTFSTGSDYFEQYDKLPYAYEPTLFLGNDAFEDVNLLSNVRRYKTFAASGNVTEGGSQAYYFPTDYEQTKHGDFSFEVNFYEGRYEGLENIYPIFLGIEGENFDDGTLLDNGVLENESGLISIENIFYPTNPFEFYGTSSDANPTIITNIVGLDQDWFFKSRVFGDNSKDVFNYLLEYIKTNSSRLIDEGTNHILGFNVQIEYTAIYKDATTNFVNESKIERGNIVVYAQLRSLEIDSFQFVNDESLESSVLTVEDLNNTTYPSYPTTTGTYEDFDISSNPVQVSNLSLSNFVSAAKNKLKQERESLEHGDLARVFGQYYEQTDISDEATSNLNDFGQWIFFRQNDLANQSTLVNPTNKTSVEYAPLDDFPSYPNFTADSTYDLNGGDPIELDNFSTSDFNTAANNYFNANLGDFNDGERVAIRGQYFEKEFRTVAASADVNENRNTWTFYKSFSLNQGAIQESQPNDTIIDLGTNTSSDQSDTYFETQFNNYVANNKENFRPYISETVALKLQATSSSSSTSYGSDLVSGNWQMFTGPFPTNYRKEINISNVGDYRLYFDTNMGPYTTLSVAGNNSKLQMYNSSNQIIDEWVLGDLYQGEIGGFSEIEVIPNTTKVVFTIYKGYDDSPIAGDEEVLNLFNTSFDIRMQQITTSTTTTSRTVYQRIQVVDDGTMEFDTDVTFGNASTFPTHLSFSNPNSYPVLENVFVDYNPSDVNLLMNESGFVSAVEAKLQTLVDNITTPPQGNAFAKVFAQGTDTQEGTFGASLVIYFSYVKTGQQEFQYRQSFVLLGDVENIILEDDDIIPDDKSTIDGGNYPTFTNTNNDDVVEYPTVISQENENFLYDATFRNTIENYLLENVETFSGDPDVQYNGFVKVKAQTEFNNETKGVSIVIPFTYSKEFTRTIQRRQSYVYTTEIVKVSEVIGTNQLYEFFFDDLEKRFELRLKDYFYDYNNEPSISLKVSFAQNPDYEYIAKSRFGTTFGSEDRLFLAGNPDFPNVDRYNVSNDLLGVDQRSQSYELSYFPSRNFRVLGGKGAINGYVTATDSILYVTKEDYPNDDKLFIRQRVLNENGVLGYTEFKTSVNKTPLNHRCIVRFNNDVVMLTKNGLYAIELSENVLTDERLLKLRSGFINKDLVAKLEAYDEDKVFILENNLYMYIFVGQDVYVADSRYTDKNDNNIIENLSYEIIYWRFPQTFKTGHITKNTFKILNESGKFIYTLDPKKNEDDKFDRYDQVTNAITFGDNDNNAFVMPVSLQFVITNPQDYTLRLYSGYKVVGKKDVDYTIANNEVTYINRKAFRGVEEGKTYYFKDANDDFYPFVVDTSTPLRSFTYLGTISGSDGVIYESIANKPLYISTIFTFDQINYVRLSPYPQTQVLTFTRFQGETDEQYTSRLVSNFKDNEDYFFETSGLKDVIVSQSNRIEMVWISGITDLGNRMMDKTTYKVNLYATKKDEENSITFGYKTRRRANIDSERDINLSNPNTFNRLNFDNFGFSTFSETGISLPMKENNFLYVQFYIQGLGQIELNSFTILYKNNRMIKTIG